MIRGLRVLLSGLLLAGSAAHANPLDVPRRSVSLSRQFVVYCDDLALRLGLSSFAEETKASVLGALGQSDHWVAPIVITARPQETNRPLLPPSEVTLVEVEGGFKVELAVKIGADPRDIRLEQQITRAVLLEIAYRNSPSAVKGGRAYLDPPTWLVEGLVQMRLSREKGVDASLFQALIDGGKLLPLEAFLAQRPGHLDSTSRKLYGYYSMSLVQLLSEMPDGRAAMALLLKGLPAGEDPNEALTRRFPALAGTEQSVEKWWALGVARLAAANRYKGFSIAETERRLDALLTLQITPQKSDSPKQFALGDFKQYLKHPQARPALRAVTAQLIALGANAHPLFRPIVAEYQGLTTNLARGKTSRVKERLMAAARYRELVLHRMDEIADYMNWFEATQSTTRSTAFDAYLKAAGEPLTASAPRGDAISRYLDEMVLQFP
jgi:hypothetical protein